MVPFAPWKLKIKRIQTSSEVELFVAANVLAVICVKLRPTLIIIKAAITLTNQSN